MQAVTINVNDSVPASHRDILHLFS